jgi:hypothetical protein
LNSRIRFAADVDEPKDVGDGPYGVRVSAALTRALVSPDVLLDDLDPEQRQVATALTGPVAVIAGAGTGKTRAITYRRLQPDVRSRSDIYHSRGW